MADIEMLLSMCCDELGSAHSVDGLRIDDNDGRGLLAAALDHGLIGPLQNAPKSRAVPEAVLWLIQTAYLTQAANNFQLIAALDRILRSFSDCSIKVAVLKGPAVALIAHGHIANREFTDLDLLVQPEDFSRARQVLFDLGYRQIGLCALSPPNSQKDAQFVKDDTGALVELHWALNPSNRRFPLEATGIWSRLQTVSFRNLSIPTLGLEDTLLALCIHGAAHRWESLKWAFDIAQILTSNSDVLDWSALLQRCDRVGCNRALLFGVQLACLLFSVEVPEPLKKLRSENPSLMRLADRVRTSLVGGEPLSRPDCVACHIKIHDRLWDRLFVAVTVPVPDLPRLLPASASPLTSGPLRFITRPVRLFRLYGFDWLRNAIGR